MTSSKKRPSLFFPLLIVLIGILLLLKTLSILDDDFVTNILRYWPILLIISGLDGYYQKNGYVGPTISIGVGIIFLLSNLGYLEINIWSFVLKFWPVLIIAAGFDILVGRRSFLFAVMGVIIGIGLLAGMFWLSGNLQRGSFRTNTESIQIENSDQVMADLTLIPKVSEIYINNGTSEDLLLEADIQFGNREILEKTINEDESLIMLENTSTAYSYPFPGASNNGLWDIKLNNEIPFNLQTDLVIGNQNLDLSDLNIKELTTETILGKNTIKFPANGSTSATIELIIGEIILYVPEDTAVSIEADTSLTIINMPQGFTKIDSTIKSTKSTENQQKINIKINQPMGILTVEYY